MTNNKTYGIVAIVIVLLTATAAIASYMTRENLQPTVTAKAPGHVVAAKQPAQQVQQVPKCDDGNIVGTVAGGVAGGVLGNQLGDGKGKTVATIGGVVGGAYVGNQYLPTRNVTCRN